MLGGEKSTEPWKSTLKFIGRCPVCSVEYKQETVRFISEHDSSRLIHINCNKCHNHFVAAVVIAGQGISSVGMVTDLDYEDALRLHKKPVISLDEVINGYEFFENNIIKI